MKLDVRRSELTRRILLLWTRTKAAEEGKKEIEHWGERKSDAAETEHWRDQTT